MPLCQNRFNCQSERRRGQDHHVRQSGRRSERAGRLGPGLRLLTPRPTPPSGLGVDKTTASPNIYDVLINGADIHKAVVSHLTVTSSRPQGPGGATVEMIGIDHREHLLKQALSQLKDDYDYILVDCPPSLELLTLNALRLRHGAGARPVQYYALEGLFGPAHHHPYCQALPQPLHCTGGSGPHHV